MEEGHMGHLPKTLPEARDHPQYRPKQAMQQERLAGFKEFVQSQWTGLLFGYSKRLGYGGGSFMYWNLVISRVVVKSSEVTGLLTGLLFKRLMNAQQFNNVSEDQKTTKTKCYTSVQIHNLSSQWAMCLTYVASHSSYFCTIIKQVHREPHVIYLTK